MTELSHPELPDLVELLRLAAEKPSRALAMQSRSLAMRISRDTRTSPEWVLTAAQSRQ